MDGKKTLATIWETACERLGDDMPTQDEVISLLSQLYSVDALQTETLPDIAALHKRHKKEKKNKVLAFLRSPMSIKIPLIDPDKFLSSTLFLVRPFFSWPGLLLFAVIFTSGLIVAATHWGQLSSNVTDRVLSRENLVLLWFIYPIVKAIHEMGHGYATKMWGGEVHEMGIMFLVFIPVPYVDASSSSVFRNKKKRMIVGGAGIMVEMMLAALALLVWVTVEAGTVRVIAYNVMIIAGVSTLLFNGNPLLRFDAYYVLADWLEMPNLGQRGNSYISYLLKRYLLRMPGLQSPASAEGEEWWLASYAIAAFIYRIFITIRIVIFVVGRFFFIGVALALWSAFGMVVMPVYKIFHHIFTDMQMKQYLPRVLTTIGLLLTIALGFILLAPMPSFTVTEGVVWIPEESQVYAGADGFITEVMARPGSRVKEGDPLISFELPELMAKVNVQKAKLKEFKARLRLSTTKDIAEAQILKEEIIHIKAELARAIERSDALIARSPAEGVFLLPQKEEDTIGRFMRNGTAVGYVVDFSNIVVRTLISQDDIEKVRHETKNVEALLSESIFRKIPGKVMRVVPSASRELPSLALAIEGGGEIATDPSSREQMQTFEKYFQIDIAMPGLTLKRVGERVYVRFEHEPEPLLYRWYRSIRRMLLRRLNF
jgi:putative peptide zinc metalloprotease protein